MKISLHHVLALGFTLPALAAAPTAAPKKATHQYSAAVMELTSLDEYNDKAASTKPTVIVVSTDNCSACEMLVKPVSKMAVDYPEVDVYWLNANSPSFKGLKKATGLTAFPHTRFMRPGEKVQIVEGTMGEKELDDKFYRLLHGKSKPLPKRAPQNPPAKAA